MAGYQPKGPVPARPPRPINPAATSEPPVTRPHPWLPEAHDLEALQRAVSHIREWIHSMEQTIEACHVEYPDRAAYWQGHIDDLHVAIAVLERS